MRRRTAATCSLLLVAAAFLIPPLLGSCAAVPAHRLPRHAPGTDVNAVMLPGGGGGGGAAAAAWEERGGRSRAREGRELAARRLGRRAPLGKPPSPTPHGMTGMVMPLPPPPPPSVSE